MNDLKSIEGVCEIAVHAPTGNKRGWVLVEIPHGATRKSDYERVEAKLKSVLPKELIHFFFVNTDIGAPEAAAYLGRTLPASGIGVVVARCLMPRTFIDTNRVIAKQATKGLVVDGMTPAVPGYIDDAGDAEWLTSQHAAYHALVSRAYARVCGEEKGLAVQMHSFAPKSVSIEKTDAGIIEALHAAYVPETYAKWPERPQVDLIAATADGSFRCSPKLVQATKAAYAEAGIKAEENATYHLHPSTKGLEYARAYPEKVLCVELNRGLVADPFVPFGESPISPTKVQRMTAPIEKVLRAAFG